MLQLLLRAEMDGVTPETLLNGRELPMASLVTWLEDRGHGAGPIDPRAIAMVIGATGFGLVAAQPLLTAAVGWQDEDPDEVRRRCVSAIVALVDVVLRAEDADPDGGA